MILIVDTYNVLHVVGVLPPEMAGIDLAGLMQLIQSSRYAANRVELVCDGTPPVGKTAAVRQGGRIKVRFAGLSSRSHDADDLIAALIAKSSAPKRLLVVSSDNWVLRQARRRRCKTMSSEQFLGQLAADTAGGEPAKSSTKRPQSTLSGGEVAKWLSYFRMTPKELEALPNSEKSEPTHVPPQSEQAPEPAPGPEAVETHRTTRDHGPLTPDIIEEAERIWAEHSS